MSSTSRDSLRTFSPEENSVGAARWFVRRELEGWGAPDLVDTAALATSELVTNAVLHAGTTVRVRLVLDDYRLRLEVQDLHPGRTLSPSAPAVPDDSEHGRGLLITASLASAWGVDYTDTVKRVWVEIDRGHGERPLPGAEASGEDALVGVVEVSGAGLVRDWNDDARRMLGWTTIEAVGRPWDGFLDPSATDGPGPQGEGSLRAKDGTLVPVYVARHAVRDDDGSVLLVVPAAQRALLDRGPAAATPSAGSLEADPTGLRDDALARLGVDDY
ncbi:MAG: hypothetical protein HOQ45_24560, partial [Nocardioidaceae bacterium]|nr:hypothetical protein [Nocardioidaceae bacterium]